MFAAIIDSPRLREKLNAFRNTPHFKAHSRDLPGHAMTLNYKQNKFEILVLGLRVQSAI